MNPSSPIRSRHCRIASLCCALSVPLLVLTGCGGGSNAEIVPVTGTVKYDGQPVKNADVTFYPTDGGRPASGKTDDEGKFSLTTVNSNDGAAVGEHVITVSVSINTSDASQTPTSADDYAVPKAGKGKGSQAALPPKYADKEQSGLKRTVVSGETNDFAFDLK